MWIRGFILCMVVACLGVSAFDRRDKIREERLNLERLREERIRESRKLEAIRGANLAPNWRETQALKDAEELAELEELKDEENGFHTFGHELCHAERRRSCRRCPGLSRNHLVAIANQKLLEDIIGEEFDGNRLRHTPEAIELRQWIRRCHCCRSSRQVVEELARIAGW